MRKRSGMKYGNARRVWSVILALVMALSTVPLSAPTAHAAHRCPDCGDLIDGSPYCEDCYECDACCELCIECGKCSECSGSEICDNCSTEEIGDTICEECAKEKGQHCPGCEGCYYETQNWCEECGLCVDCVEICEPCSNHLGDGVLCVECAATRDSHCPECNGCFFEVGQWCETCGNCAECVEICEHCCAEAGSVICRDCAIEEGYHCPDCNDCYGEKSGDVVRCEYCNLCSDCVDICPDHEICIGCALDEGVHCLNCEACEYDVVFCEECGETCSECAEEFCDTCDLCSNCIEGFCPNCDACSNEYETLCENCEEYCDACGDFCDVCGFCAECCRDNALSHGCDCDDWVCAESWDFEDHLDESHSYAAGEVHVRRESHAWSWDETGHWHVCVYCNDENEECREMALSDAHIDGDQDGRCDYCGYLDNSEIQILRQPRDSRYAYVCDVDKEPAEKNIARFHVEAVGNSELSYTWCVRYYSNGEWSYRPLAQVWGEPDESVGETYEGPDLAVIVPSDACYSDYFVCCRITDEEGNERYTAEARLSARHDYRFYEWDEVPGEEPLVRNEHGHTLHCVGEGCDKVTGLRPHEDADRDDWCDICDGPIGEILITMQPKDVKDVYVSSALEDVDPEKNIAHFSIKAESLNGSELTYTWCRKQYVNGKETYVPLKNPGEYEVYEGPEAAILAPEDSCCTTYTYACLITDEEGNELRSPDVTLKARHHYQHFKDYLTDRENPYPGLKRQPNGHFLQCVGTGCGKQTKLGRHKDADNDYRCDICGYASEIDRVELTVTAPVEGMNPVYTVTCGSTAYRVDGEQNNGIYWYESETGGTDPAEWSLIDNTHPFEGGKYYRFEVELAAKDGFVFDKHSDPKTGVDYNSKVVASINGGRTVTAKKTYDKNLSNYITVDYNFGICNDSVIEKIAVEGITTPVAGGAPVYTASVSGSGYYVDTSRSAYDEHWQTGRKLYRIKNGVGWYDVTGGGYEYVYETDSFIPGHTYQAEIYLKTEEGYGFERDRDNFPTVTATVNGDPAEINTGWTNAVEARVSCTFTCPPKEVTTVMVSVEEPRAGAEPDFSPTVAYPEYYELYKHPNYGTGGITWYDSDGNVLVPGDTFEEGKIYKAEIKLVPAQSAVGTNKCAFDSETVAYVNGEKVTERLDYDGVDAMSDVVYIYYTFFDYIFTTQPTGETLYMDEWHNADWATSFVPDYYNIEWWNGEMWDQWDCLSDPETGEGDHDFGNPDTAGTYRFRIAAYLGGKVMAASKTFNITWKERVTTEWSGSGDKCTVTCEAFESGVSVMVVSYDADGKMLGIEYLTVDDPSVIVEGDQVKVFFLDEDYEPVRKAVEAEK